MNLHAMKDSEGMVFSYLCGTRHPYAGHKGQDPRPTYCNAAYSYEWKLVAHWRRVFRRTTTREEGA